MAVARRNDGTRRRVVGGRLITCRQAARAAMERGIRMTVRELDDMCAEWPGEFEHFPSIPWSETRSTDAWHWLIDARDFGAWLDWLEEVGEMACSITRAEIEAALPEWLTVAEVAALCGVSGITVYNRIKAGRMATDGGRPARVRKADALAYLETRRRTGQRQG